MSRQQTCTKCGKPSIPGLIRGAGKCQYHCNEGVWGKEHADRVEKTRRHKWRVTLTRKTTTLVAGQAQRQKAIEVIATDKENAIAQALEQDNNGLYFTAQQARQL